MDLQTTQKNAFRTVTSEKALTQYNETQKRTAKGQTTLKFQIQRGINSSSNLIAPTLPYESESLASFCALLIQRSALGHTNENLLQDASIGICTNIRSDSIALSSCCTFTVR